MFNMSTIQLRYFDLVQIEISNKIIQVKLDLIEMINRSNNFDKLQFIKENFNNLCVIKV